MLLIFIVKYFYVTYNYDKMRQLRQTLTPISIVIVMTLFSLAGYALLVTNGTPGDAVFAAHDGKNAYECHQEYDGYAQEKCVEHSECLGEGADQERCEDTDETCEDDETEVSVAIGGENCVSNDNLISQYLKWIIQFLTGGVGLVITLMIVVSGVQYTLAGSSPDKVQQAKSRLKNAIIGLVLFILLSAILNYLVPGGLL